MDFHGFPKPEIHDFLPDFRRSERGEHRNLIKTNVKTTPSTNARHATEENAEEDQTLASGEEGSEKTE